MTVVKGWFSPRQDPHGGDDVCATDREEEDVDTPISMSDAGPFSLDREVASIEATTEEINTLERRISQLDVARQNAWLRIMARLQLLSPPKDIKYRAKP